MKLDRLQEWNQCGRCLILSCIHKHRVLPEDLPITLEEKGQRWNNYSDLLVLDDLLLKPR